MMRTVVWGTGSFCALAATLTIALVLATPSAQPGPAIPEPASMTVIAAVPHDAPAGAALTETYYQPPQRTGATGTLSSIPPAAIAAQSSHVRARAPRTPLVRPYTDADAAADVVAAWGAAPEEPGHQCYLVNYGKWSRGSIPPGPDLGRIGPGGWVGFLAHSIGDGGEVQYFGCYA
jgi:hypothetical protein